jgi:hypothetical protein
LREHPDVGSHVSVSLLGSRRCPLR